MLRRTEDIAQPIVRDDSGGFRIVANTGPEWAGGTRTGNINMAEVSVAGLVMRKGNLCKGIDGEIYEAYPYGLSIIYGKHSYENEFEPSFTTPPTGIVPSDYARVVMDANNDYCIVYATAGGSLMAWSSATNTHEILDEYIPEVSGMGMERLPDGTIIAIVTFDEHAARTYMRDPDKVWSAQDEILAWTGLRLQNIWLCQASPVDITLKAGLLRPAADNRWEWVISESNKLPVTTSTKESLTVTASLEEISWGGEWNPVELETSVYIGGQADADVTRLWADGTLTGCGFEVAGTSTSDAIECWIPDRPCASANERDGWTESGITNTSVPYTGGLLMASGGHMSWPTIVAPCTIAMLIGWNTAGWAAGETITVSFGAHSIQLYRYQTSYPFPAQRIGVKIDGSFVGSVGASPYASTTGMMRLEIGLSGVENGERTITVKLNTPLPEQLDASSVVSAHTNRLNLMITCSGASSYWYGIGTQDDVGYDWEIDIPLIASGFEIVNSGDDVVDDVTGAVIGDNLHVEASDHTMSKTTRTVVFSVDYYDTINDGADYAWYELLYSPLEWRRKKETLSVTASLETITWS